MKCEKLIRSVLKVLRPTSLSAPNAIESSAVKTHTGQAFDPRDCRSARFMQSTKLVNKQFAVELIENVPPKRVTERIVACDGGHGALGHPKVYINLDKPGLHTCGYCGLRYEKVGAH
ncbi:putative NADH dehydrogenase [ubiquinone] iron-sulfur protein 6, mitochondrial [Echinococcus granulosus]|uniref:NADH dehydrogenase [ubiquinone] iron-sulfur protein 6 n=1 Tax=Echinococcus granulosus TaxID=6210 RepID=W6UKF9_ECHGR|nr:putative NADH dehydrogenase [ubiquinone] iron-sulfur protein 6 [Echinococcus granulosus]EUB61563.1 putative NADH dehydrogenase [ubiquinone] iron-sulfur protein 6 [Echinococcus granulosus]KAH9280854.1 putative NADH dehydrogenase [ubiquinone] iron-sulfur protein 6, mitochondrial [Echinococcus granulosus]